MHRPNASGRWIAATCRRLQKRAVRSQRSAQSKRYINVAPDAPGHHTGRTRPSVRSMSSKVPEMVLCHRTRPVMHDRTHPSVRCSLCCMPRHLHRTHEQCHASVRCDFRTCIRSMSRELPRAPDDNRTCPVTIDLTHSASEHQLQNWRTDRTHRPCIRCVFLHKNTTEKL
jgi:hypothetical protein